VRYLSICSGIEAASVAWHGLGWEPVAFSEIEPFPSAVLAHHYPHVPNLGDMTKFKEWNLEPIDLLVGGTPCQSFSVAGLRKGLHDPRGGLMLTFLEIAQRYRPRWVVWENVPGVLSSNGGRDFGAFLGALGELGYGWAYRVLDAQWFGVAQRRRRVFVVACLGDQASAAAVLFESESVQRNPAPSREKGQGAARGVTRCFAGSSESGVAATLETTSHDYSRADGFNMVAQPVAGSHWDSPANPHPTLNQSAKGSGGIAASDQELFSQRGSGLVAQPVAFKVRGGVEVDSAGKAAGKGYLASEETAFTLAATQDQWIGQPMAIALQTDVTPKASEELAFTLKLPSASGGGQPQAVAFGTDCYNGAITGDVAATIGTPGSSVNASGPTVMQAVDVKQVQWASGGGQVENDTAQALRAGAEYNYQFARVAMQVRRLTPTECERLQGFPDGFTNIPWRKKPEAPDGPRYKALGNSMAVPCMRWLGERIQAATARQESP
jgi:DNA (cytosine-5)-methyltransferase 1